MPDEADQIRQVAPERRGTAVQMRMGVEQFRPVEPNSVRNADEAHKPAGPRAPDACIMAHWRRSQEDGYSFRQCGHALSQAANEPITNCPGFTVVTALPAS